MKTAQVIRRFSFSEWGGTECVVWNTSKMLSAFGDEPEIVATNALEKTSFEIREGVEIRRFGYFYPYFPLGRRKNAVLDKKGGNPYVPELAYYLGTRDFELLHCHTMGRIAGLVRQAAAMKRIPYVMSFHGGCFDVPEKEMSEMLKPLRHTLRYGGALDRLFGLRKDPLADAAGLLCVGRNELAPARERFPDKIVEYLPNGVDVEHFHTVSGEVDFRRLHGIPPERKLLLSVSRIDYQKNQQVLLEVLDRLLKGGGEWHLLLIGPPTSAWYYAGLRKKAAALNLNDFLTIIPGLPPDSPELPAAYHAADLFFLPSLHEPFGIVILEAWSAGVPVIASPVGGINYLIRDGENGCLAAPEDPETMSAAARFLLSPEGAEQRRKMIDSAYAEAVREYSWATITRRLKDFYERVKTS